LGFHERGENKQMQVANKRKVRIERTALVIATLILLGNYWKC